MSKIRLFAFVAVTLFTFVSCFKEKSLEASTNTPGTGGGGGGGGTVNTFGFSLKDGAGTEFKGCVDTVAVTAAGPLKVMGIELSDDDGNIFIILISTTSNFTTGTFTPAQGAGMTAQVNGNAYVSASDFTVKVTAVSATEVSIEFSGSLTNPAGGSYKITDGKATAKIGADTPC